MKNSFFNKMMHSYNEISTKEGELNFAKEGFDQLFDEYSKELNKLPNNDPKNFVKGLAVGAVAGGLTVAVVVGIGEYIRRKTQQNMIREKEEFKRTLEEFKEYVDNVEPGDLKIKNGKIVN